MDFFHIFKINEICLNFTHIFFLSKINNIYVHCLIKKKGKKKNIILTSKLINNNQVKLPIQKLSLL